MANLLDEDLLPFLTGLRTLPGRPHISTGYRYALRGIRGVKLETIMCGGRRFTSRQALRRFVAEVTKAASPDATPTTINRQGNCGNARIERDLDDAGI